MRTEDLDLSTLVTLLAPAMTQQVVARLAEEGFPGVTRSHGYVVQRLLVEHPTIGALARSLGVTQQAVSKQVADLQGLGYVERVPVRGDGRVRAVALTPRGRAMVEATRRVRADVEQEVVARVGARRVASAKTVLAALVEMLDLTDRVASRTVPDPGV